MITAHHYFSDLLAVEGTIGAYSGSEGVIAPMATGLLLVAAQLSIAPQQRHPPVLSPRLCHNGGCPRDCRRFLWRKIRKSVAVPVLTAAHFGDYLPNSAIDRHYTVSYSFLVLESPFQLARQFFRGFQYNKTHCLSI